jgi:AcrR family transcriptional regulator
VGEIQRARIAVAMTELVRERGVSAVTVAHIVARSRVSRRTFYELFENREDCFDAALDRALAKAGEAVLPAYEAGGPWRARIAAGLEAALAFIDAEPEIGYLCIVAALGAGPGALERRMRVTEALVAAVHEGRLESRAARRPRRLVAEGVVGAVLAILHARLQARDSKPLLGLRNQLMATIVLPYLGAGAAERELKRLAPRAPRSRPRGARGDALRELDMRLTYRTVRVLLAISAWGEREATGERGATGGRGPNNRQVASDAGIADQGQISKLLARLQALGLIANTGGNHAQGEPNAWTLTPKGRDVTRALEAQAV